MRVKTLLRLSSATAAAAVVLAGCSSLPSGEVPIVNRNVAEPGAAAPTTTTGVVESRVGGLIDSGRTHTVTVGDTIYNISQRYGVSTSDLMQLNGVVDPTTLRIGQVLHLPRQTKDPVTATAVEGVRVHRFETMAPISTATVVSPAGTHASAEPSITAPVVTAQERAAKTVETVKSEAVSAKESVKSAVETKTEVVQNAVKEAAAAAAVIPGTRLIWPARGDVLSTFAQNGKGIDIGGAQGSVVVAAGAGQVLFVGDGVTGYGNLVIVKHSPTLVTAYGHNSKVVVKPCDQVKAGQKIAEMGSSAAPRVQLRFEVRDKGKPVDPMKYLPPARN